MTLPSIQRVNYSLLISLCHLLITFANRLDQDQARHNIRLDLSKPEKKILKKLIFKKNQQTTKKAWKYSQGANVNPHNFFR